jgi:hypothetical protein
MFDQLSAEKLASLIKGVTPTTPTTTKQNVDPAVYYVYSRVKINCLSILLIRLCQSRSCTSVLHVGKL